ncbi:hypothetical protein ACGGZK_14720 [Agromyces sp. MMS24-K17]|uniref:hypothetical protein n=1 Tax=Agromyces sp. MMS24-K17 TaxID=3372850 RepID=UPI003754EBB5
MTNYAELTKSFRDEITRAVTTPDPDLTDEANATRQRRTIAQARERLLAARPQLPQPGQSRDAVLAALLPRTADEIAVAQHEQTKVRALLDAGQSLTRIIADATPERALAIADLVETLPDVLVSESRAEIIAETHAAVFDRLADLGVGSAARARTVEQENAPALAWRRAMTEVAESFDASIGTWQDVYRVDREGYELARSGGDDSTAHQLRRVDGTPVTA